MKRATPALLCIALASCGGGGGSSAAPAVSGGPPGSAPAGAPSPTPVSTAAATPSPTPTPASNPTSKPTPVPTSTPTPVSSTASVSGRVTDDNGAAVSGATVYVGASLPRNAGPVTSGALTTTGADGSFAVSGIVGANTGVEYNASGGYDYSGTWIVVWPKDAALPVYHASRTLANPTGANALGATIVLRRMSAADLNAVSTINAYGATQGSGPLAIDEIAVEAANAWAAYAAAHPGVNHSCPGSDPTCVNAQMYENAYGERGAGENIGPDSNWNGNIAGIESESANCRPQPAQYASCSAFAQTSLAAFESVGHWLNLVDPSATWIGVGTAPYGGGYTVFDMETSTL